MINSYNYTGAFNKQVNAIYSADLLGHVSFVTLQYVSNYQLSNSTFQAYGQGGPMFLDGNYDNIYIAMDWLIHDVGTTNNVVEWPLTNAPAVWLDQSGVFGAIHADIAGDLTVGTGGINDNGPLTAGSADLANTFISDVISSGTSSALTLQDTPGGGYGLTIETYGGTFGASIDVSGNIVTAGNEQIKPLASSPFLYTDSSGNVLKGTMGAGLAESNGTLTAITGGVTTNIVIGGHTFYYTNGILMNVQ
jgi:hypothetical protein